MSRIVIETNAQTGEVTERVMTQEEEAELDALLAPARIAELKRLLEASDYKVLPDYDKPDNGIRAQRQAWREEVRELEERIGWGRR
jgi:hypothetical protein